MLSEFSVKKPFTIVVAIVLVLILGFVSFTKMNVDLIPSINLPYAVVVTTYGGASPEQVETVVTDTVEQALASVENMDEITSISAENMSMVILKFNDDTDMNGAVLEMRESLDMISAYFPDGIGSPMIFKINPDMLPAEVITAGVDGMSDSEAAAYIEDKIIPEIKSVEGVASVTSTGLVENYIDVTLKQDKIDTLNKSISDFIDQKVDEIVDGQSGMALPFAITQGSGLGLSSQPQLSSAGGNDAFSGLLGGIFGGDSSDDAEDEEELFGDEDEVEDIDNEIIDEEVGDEDYADDIDVDLGEEEEEEAPADPEAQKEALRSSIRAQILKAMGSEDEVDVSSMITADMIKQILTAQNFSMPAGSADDDEGISHLIRVGDKYASADEIASQVLISVEGYGEIKISDIADVTSYDNTGLVYSKINGTRAVMLAIQKQPNYSTVEVTNAVAERTEKLTADNSSVSFNVLMNQGDYVNLMIKSIMQNLLLGAAFAIIILFIFLRRVRPTLIVAASILISVVTTFVLMYFSGITLNLISMGGLAVGIGMLVDNSIVVIENIFRMLAQGKSRRDAAVMGAKQVAGAITSSTLTTIVVFVPIVFTTGITKQLFTDMALTIGYSLVSSLVVALTLVPMACSSWLGKKEITFKKNFSDKLSDFYGKLLEKVLNRKAAVVIGVTLLFAASIFAALSSGTSLFPSMDSGNISVSVTLPENMPREDKYERLDRLNDTLLSVDGVKTVGIMDTSDSSDAEASLMNMASTGTTVYCMLDENRSRSTDEITDEIRSLTENLDYEVSVSGSGYDMSMLSGSSVSIEIKGRELDDIRKAAADIAEIVSLTEGTTEVESGVTETKDELRVIVDKNKAMEKGITTAQVYMAVSAAAAGESASASFTTDGTDYSIYVKDERKDSFKPEDLKNVTVTSASSGEEIPVSDVAEIISAEGFSSIMRSNQERTVTVTADLLDGYDVTDVNSEISDKLEDYAIPSGCTYKVAGESESIRDTFTDLAQMILLGIIFIYLVMVAQFQSLLSPFIVMFTIPLAFTGGFLALFFTGTDVSVISLIGLVVLVGIVVNNGIVYVDYTNQLVAEGMGVNEALIKTGRDRLRPILMTALTTIIALVGMVFDNSMGSEMIKPIAITTIGGMLYATLLTLVFVPVMYRIFHSKKREAK